MNGKGSPEMDALIEEIHALRSENKHLRSLLGLDKASLQQVTQRVCDDGAKQ
jgi:regulator of replication initiation timing